jgi:hypothetical protein
MNENTSSFKGSVQYTLLRSRKCGNIRLGLDCGERLLISRLVCRRRIVGGIRDELVNEVGVLRRRDRLQAWEWLMNKRWMGCERTNSGVRDGKVLVGHRLRTWSKGTLMIRLVDRIHILVVAIEYDWFVPSSIRPWPLHPSP